MNPQPQTEATITEAEIQELVENQRQYFRSNATRSIEFRSLQLEKFRDLIRRYEDELYAAAAINYPTFFKQKSVCEKCGSAASRYRF